MVMTKGDKDPLWGWTVGLIGVTVVAITPGVLVGVVTLGGREQVSSIEGASILLSFVSLCAVGLTGMSYMAARGMVRGRERLSWAAVVVAALGAAWGASMLLTIDLWRGGAAGASPIIVFLLLLNTPWMVRQLEPTPRKSAQKPPVP